MPPAACSQHPAEMHIHKQVFLSVCSSSHVPEAGCVCCQVGVEGLQGGAAPDVPHSPGALVPAQGTQMPAC